MAIKSATSATQDEDPASNSKHASYTDDLDFDMPMSDMSDVSPNIETADASRDAHAVTRSAGADTAMRLITRPESAGDDVSMFVVKPRPTVLQPGKLSRMRPKARSENLIQNHRPSPDGDHDPVSPKASTKKNDIRDPSDDGTDLDNFRVLPITDSEQPFLQAYQRSHNKSDALAQNNPSARTPEPEHERAAVTKTISDDAINAESQEQQQNGQHGLETWLESGTHNEPSNSDVNHSLVSEGMTNAQELAEVPTRGHTTTPNNHISRNLSVQPRTTNAGRVQKSKPMPKCASTLAFDNKIQTQSGLTSRTQPTEEDLLYLLMHRARQKKQLVFQDLQQQAELERQNDTLLKSQADLQDALQNAQVENDSLAADIQMARNELDVFKTKYKKLKTWAREVNADFVELKQSGQQIKVSLTDLQSEHVESQNHVREEIKSSSHAVRLIQGIKQSLVETRQPVETLGLSLRKTHAQLIEKHAELRALKVVESQHRSYVQQLSERQIRVDQSNTSFQNRLTDSLKALSERMNTQTTTKHTATLGECLQLLKELSKHDAGKRDGLKGISVTMDRIQATLISLEASIKHDTQNSVEPDAVLNAITAIKDTVETIRPDMNRYQELRELNARHEETIKNQDAIRQLFENDQQCARAREAETFKTNSVLIQQITDKKQCDKDLCAAQENTLQTKLNEIQSQKDAESRKLEEAQAKILSCQALVGELKQQLETDRSHFRNVNSDLRAKHDQEVRAVKTEGSAKHDQLHAEMVEQIKERDTKIASISEALRSKQHEINITKQELAGVLCAKHELTKNLQEMQKDVLHAQSDLKKEKFSYSDLLAKYENLEAQTSAIPNLRMGLEQKANAVNRLQADLEKLSGVDEQLQQVRTELVSQQGLADELQNKLSSAEATQSQVDVLRVQLTERDREIKGLCDDLAGTRQQVSELSRQEKSFREKNAELVKLQSLLEDTQQQCKRIPELEAHNQTLEQQIKNHNDELQELRECIGMTDELEKIISQKDELITTYEKNSRDVQLLRSQLQMMQEQLQHKDKVISAQNDEIAKVKLPPHQCSNDDLANFFTQNTDLSIDTPTQSETQVTQDDSNWTASNGTMDAQSGVDPRCIMAATPSGRVPATRSNTSTSQAIVIPDSQQGNSAGSGFGSQDDSQSFGISNRISSPLSDVDEEFLEQETHVRAGNGGRQFRGLKEIEDKDDNDSGDDLLPKSPEHHSRFRIVKPSNLRPTSAISQDEMLLSTIESRRQGTPSTHNTAPGHPRSNRTPARPESDRHRTDQSPVRGPSLRRPRGNTQNQGHIDPVDASSDDAGNQLTQTPPRERNRPNSAVKRRIEQNPTAGIPNQPQGKRLKRPNGSLKHFISSSIESISTVPDDDVPRSSGTHRISSSSISTSSRASKKSRTARKPSRQDKYTAQFGSGNR